MKIFNRLSTILIPVVSVFSFIIAFVFPSDFLTGMVLCILFFTNILRWCIIPNDKNNFFLILFSIFSVLIFFGILYLNPYTWCAFTQLDSRKPMTEPETLIKKEQAILDVQYAVGYLKKIHPTSRILLPGNVELALEKVMGELSVRTKVDKIDLARKLESVCSQFNDAHTEVYFKFEDSRYLKYAYRHQTANDTFVSINGLSKEDIFNQNRQLFSTESDDYAIGKVGNYLTSLEGLAFLGIDSKDDFYIYKFRHTDGTAKEYIYHKSDFVTIDEYCAFNKIENLNSQKTFVHYEIDTENNVGIFTLDSCINDETYKQTARNFFDEIKKSGIKNIVVDLRNNGGGNSTVVNEFLRYLSAEDYQEESYDMRFGIFSIHKNGKKVKNQKYDGYNFDGNIYVLTSVHTFSSAMMFAMFIKDNKLGQIIGEASGNNPSSFGDVVSFRLPYSKLYLQVSWKKFYRIDSSKENEFIMPDFPCDSSDALTLAYKILEKNSSKNDF